MSREAWEGKKVRVFFQNGPVACIERVVRRTPADTGDTWYIVREPDNFYPGGEYAVQAFAYMEVIDNE